ncbi:MAG: ribosomal biogenesis protein [Candidatus Thermoplasmatota archaeon]|nr:ribosomal biogenesis protein [Candidatus Thermoplasmatota archaeon]
MKLVTKWFGVFFVENNKIIKYELFPKNSGEIAERLKKINDGKILDEEKKLTEGLKIAKGEVSIDYADYGFTPDLLHDASIKLGKMLAGKTSEERYVIQAVNAIDEINKAINIMNERFVEWYSYHFPEKKEKDFMEIIAEYGGEDKTNPETEPLRDIASSILALQKTKNRLEKYVEKSMKKIAPNLSSFAGPMIGAKLISLAGGLGRLSVMPSSTIQLLGAEKALFRHLKEGSKSPKHGILLQHPIVHQADYKHRGRIARVFANNIAIAVKADCYSKRFIADELGKRFKKQMG